MRTALRLPVLLRPPACRILDRVSDELNCIAPARRRQMALVLMPFGAVLLVAGAVPVLAGGIVWKLVGVVLIVLAVLVLGVAWGLQRSAALDEAAAREQQLDDAILGEAALTGADSCGSNCGACGVDDCAVKSLRRV